jgi:tetratricopeptide (TPR) repeat protein
MIFQKIKMYKIKLKNESIFHDKIKKKQPKTLMSIKFLFSPSHYCNFAMMKHLFFLLLGGYLFVSFAACKQHRPYDGQLAHIDSLADVNPDSADVLLKPALSPSMKGEEKDEVALLLRIKVDDKLYRPVTHYRDTILQLVSYFEQHPKALPSVLGSTGPALPYLYAGRIFADLGDAPQALDYYQRALDVQSTTHSPSGRVGDRSRLAMQRGLILSQIGEQFFFQGLHEEALHSFQEANAIAEMIRDTLSMIFKNRDIAEQYKFMNENDSSIIYYFKSLKLAEDFFAIEMCNDVKSQLASLYIQKEMYDSARIFIMPSLIAIDSANITATYNIASKIYRHEGYIDSAVICYDKLLDLGNIYGRRNAHRELSEIAMERGNLKSATAHFRQYKLLDDSIRKMDNAETVARMHAAYNYQKHKRRTFELELSNARKEKLIIVILSFVVIFSCAIYLYYKQYTKRQDAKTARLRQVIEEKERQSLARQEEALKKVSELAKQIEEIQQESLSTNEHHQAEVRRLAAEKAQLLFMLKKQKDADDVKKMGVDAIMSSPSYHRFVELDNERTNTPKLSEWSDLSSEVAKFFPNFEKNLKGSCKMSNQQYRACLLRMLKFGPSSASYLCCYGKSSISSLYTRLYEKITGKKGSMSDFDTLLESFLHD